MLNWLYDQSEFNIQHSACSDFNEWILAAFPQ